MNLENNGWLPEPWVEFWLSSSPLSHYRLPQYLLFLARSHQGSLEVSWTKSHANDVFNNKVDKLAKFALTGNHTVNVSEFLAPSGWVDSSLPIAYQSLKLITEHVIKDSSAPPFSTDRYAPFIISWQEIIYDIFGHHLDAGLHSSNVWKINVPSSLCELLWKEITSSLPLGSLWNSSMALGHHCHCGSIVSLDHMWSGCDTYDMAPLLSELHSHIKKVSGWDILLLTKNPLQWQSAYWQSLLALHSLEHFQSS